uniref:RNA-binding protein 19 n=1 Tax=Steinernema glaseri TaxID=37863 RepID=A0A1I7YW15_9BILA
MKDIQMSRLIVKGLPNSTTEDKLRKHFAGYGTITDCQLKYTRDGVFRRFAFVGFDSEDSAAKAANYFNNTYIGTTRIAVEECKPFGDDTKPRAWSKYSKENQKRKPEESAEEVKDDGMPPAKKSKVVDPKFAAFMDLHGQNTNEELEGDHNVGESQDLLAELMKGIYGDTKLSLVLSGLPSSIKVNSLKEWLTPIRFKAVKIVRNNSEAMAFITFNRLPDVRRALLRNEQYLGGFRIKIEKAPSGEGGPSRQEDDEPQLTPEEEAALRKSETEKTTAAILETGRLFVRNLPYICSNDDLLFLFKPFGEIAECQNVIDKKTGKSKGFAVVTFVFPENAAAAYAALDGSVFKGRMLHLLPGEEKREDNTLDPANQKGLSAFQKEKQAKLKANAGKAHSWNALFLGANAVADTLANKLDVSKADLLTGDDEASAGVRLALAETRLVRETRQFLLEHGVKLDAFSRPATKRSETVIIVKNLPGNADQEELKRMFGRFGEIKQFVMPPEGGVSAIVEMGNSIDAKKAFTSLAYSRFRTQPLYLEWAPVDVFVERTEDEKPSGSEKRDDTLEKPVMKKEIKEEIDEPSEEAAESPEDANDEGETHEEAGATLFVKNLNFETTEQVLEKHFSKRWPVVKATVSTKKDLQNPDKLLSMGFGFVQFYKKRDAEVALRECQGELLDGHSIEVKLSHREQQEDEAVKRKRVSNLEQGDCTNIMVRNIPFQAVKKEITQLFAAFGELKSVRLPKKVGGGGSHRGFGFVDFMTKGDAKRAFDALVHSTHLYGRRLVLEWAKAEDSVEDLRERTKEKFSGEKGFKKKKERLEAIERTVAELADD